MAKILSYYHLCPINDEKEFLGLSQDSESGTVINTLGKNIIISVKLSNQKQKNSWTVLDKLSSKVVYDFNTKEYVGVFANKWIRCWPQECTDINKIRKIKLSKPIETLITIQNENTLVLYTDGTCESLECAIDLRKEKKDISLPQNRPIVDSKTSEILDVTYFKTANDSILFSYFARSRNDDAIHFIYFSLDCETLTLDGSVYKFKLTREDQNTKLNGFTVVDGNMCPQLVTIWSDRRIFMMPLRHDSLEDVPGHFVSMLNAINVDQPLSVIGISRDCIAIYGATASPQEGGSLILYNTQFKVIESKQFFKIYFNNSRLWIVDKYIFLAVGQKLAVVSFRISKDQLSDMIGSQRVVDLSVSVDTECINVDGQLEEMLEFDMATQLQVNSNQILTNGTQNEHWNNVEESITRIAYENFENVKTDIRSLQQYDIIVNVRREEDLLPDMLQLNLSSNANDTIFNTESIRVLAYELNKIGASEYEITDCLVPLIIKAKLTDDLITCLRKYSNISDKMLARSLKYFLDLINETETVNLPDDEKTINSYSKQLNTVLSCSFNQELIVDHLRTNLNFDDVQFLLNHIFNALESNEVQLEERPQLGNDFDDDTLLIQWFSTLIDSHLHQFIISRDTKLVKLLTKWKNLVENYVSDIQQTKSTAAILYQLVDGKSSFKESQGSKWYSVEAFKLY